MSSSEGFDPEDGEPDHIADPPITMPAQSERVQEVIEGKYLSLPPLLPDETEIEELNKSIQKLVNLPFRAINHPPKGSASKTEEDNWHWQNRVIDRHSKDGNIAIDF